MKQDERFCIEQTLKDVPSGALSFVRHSASTQGRTLLTNQFSARTSGKGRVETYALFPGIEASYHVFLAPQIAFHHDASNSMLELFHCRSGRVGWNMRGGTAIYLGAGDMTAHSTACCADSDLMFPLGYAQGISFSVDLQYLTTDCPDIAREAGVDPARLQRMFCDGNPVAISACPEVDRIFSALYSVRPEILGPYLKLKVQELLIYLNDFQSTRKCLTQYFSQQTELIKEIHQLLTEHLDQRFTIDELSKRYLINTSTLKEVFKTVYKCRAEDFPMEQFDNIMNVNVKYLFQMSVACYPYLKKSPAKGRIINITSMSAHLGFSEVVPYCTSKGAVLAMTRGLAVEWAQDNICVNSIAPGWFRSKMTEQVVDPAREAKILGRMPLHAYGDTRDLGAMARFLIGDGATYITGQDFAVDGGALAFGY